MTPKRGEEHDRQTAGRRRQKPPRVSPKVRGRRWEEDKGEVGGGGGARKGETLLHRQKLYLNVGSGSPERAQGSKLEGFCGG